MPREARRMPLQRSSRAASPARLHRKVTLLYTMCTELLTQRACTAPLQLLSSSGQIATVMAHWTVKVPCKHIKAVALGGYVCTIFGSSTGVPPKE